MYLFWLFFIWRKHISSYFKVCDCFFNQQVRSIVNAAVDSFLDVFFRPSVDKQGREAAVYPFYCRVRELCI